MGNNQAGAESEIISENHINELVRYLIRIGFQQKYPTLRMFGLPVGVVINFDIMICKGIKM